MNILLKFLLSTTPLAPAMFIYAVVFLLDNCLIYASLFICLFILMCVACFGIVAYGGRKYTPRPCHTESIESSDHEVYSLFVIYIMPLIFKDIGDYNWTIWIIVSSAYCLIAAMSYGYFYNPILIISGYHFYKIKEMGGLSHVLITRRRIYDIKPGLSVVRLTDYLLLETTRRSDTLNSSS